MNLTELSGVAATSAVGEQTLRLGPQASLTDLGAFDRALQGATQRASTQASGALARAMFQPLDHINLEAVHLAADAKAAQASGAALTPGELVSLTVRAQEFMFHCQLTSNIANRTSDGLQQLFRQQS